MDSALRAGKQQWGKKLFFRTGGFFKTDDKEDGGIAECDMRPN